MVRDLRSVISSFEKKWRQFPEVMDSRENHEKVDFITVSQRVNYYLNQAPLLQAVARINNAIETGTINKMCVIKAEDFTRNPELMMRKVYDYLEEPYFELDYDNVQQTTIENDRIDAFGIYGDHLIKSKIQSETKDYLQTLGTPMCNKIAQDFSWFYDHFKYQK